MIFEFVVRGAAVWALLMAAIGLIGIAAQGKKSLGYHMLALISGASFVIIAGRALGWW